jgi:hypothetical protein
MAKTSPAGPPAPQEEGTLYLSALIKRKITDRHGDPVGKLSDVIARLREGDFPQVTGIVAAIEGKKVFLSTGQLAALDREVLRLGRTKIDLRWFERREGEVLLRADILGHKVIDIETAQPVRATDLLLARKDGEWVLTGVNIRRKQTFRHWSMIDPQLGRA